MCSVKRYLLFSLCWNVDPCLSKEQKSFLEWKPKTEQMRNKSRFSLRHVYRSAYFDGWRSKKKACPSWLFACIVSTNLCFGVIMLELGSWSSYICIRPDQWGYSFCWEQKGSVWANYWNLQIQTFPPFFLPSSIRVFHFSWQKLSLYIIILPFFILVQIN
jgi:hypothetical protein